MKNLWTFLCTMNREAAIDSLRDILAVLGLGTVIGDFATMRLWYVLPAFLLTCAVWYADYMRHDLPPSLPLTYQRDDPKLLAEIGELGR